MSSKIKSAIKKMMVGSLKNETKPFTVEFGGETLSGNFRPRVITFAWSRQLLALGDSPEPDIEIVNKIVEAVESWDLEYEPGQPVPLTTEALLDIPTELTLAIIDHLSKAGQPGEATAAQTAAPSVASFSKEEN